MIIFLLSLLKISEPATIISSFSLISITSSSATSSPLGDYLGYSPSSTSTFSISFFVKFTTLPTSLTAFVTIGSLSLKISTSSIKAQYGSPSTSSITLPSQITSSWVLIIGAFVQKKLTLYLIKGGATAAPTSGTYSNNGLGFSMSMSNSIVVDGTNTKGYYHSMQVMKQDISSQVYSYCLLDNIFEVDGIASNYYAFKVSNKQLDTFTSFAITGASVGGTNVDLYIDSSSKYYFLYKPTVSFTASLTGVTSFDGSSESGTIYVDVITSTSLTLAATSLANPFDPTSSSVTISVTSLPYTAFSAVCSPTGSSFTFPNQIISTTNFNIRQLYLYAIYDAQYIHSTTTIKMTYLPFGLSTLQSKAFTGKVYSIRIPFTRSKLSYKLAFTSSCSSTGSVTCSISSNVLTVSGLSNNNMVVLSLTYAGDTYYSSITFSVGSEGTLSVSTPTSLKSLPNTLISIPISFTDSYYGETDLFTHSFSATISTSDHFIINSQLRPPVFYWTGSSSATIQFTVSNIGGQSTVGSSFNYIINTPPVINQIPDMRAWSSCTISYELTFSDAESNSVTFTSSYGSVTGSSLSLPAITGTQSVTITANDGHDSSTQTFTLTEINLPSFSTSLNCITGRICIVGYSDSYTTTEISSIVSSNSLFIIGVKAYTITNEGYTTTITITSNFGCVFTQTLAVSVQSEVDFSRKSYMCEADSIASITSSEPYTVIGLNGCDFTVDQQLMTIPCSTSENHCKIISSTSYTYISFSITSYSAPTFPTFPSLFTTSSVWNGYLVSTDCPSFTCIYSISGSSDIKIQSLTGYITWNHPTYTTSYSLTLSITKQGTTYSQLYAVNPKQVLKINTIDQSKLLVNEGTSTSLTITTDYINGLTLSISPSAEINGMEINFNLPLSNTLYVLTVSDLTEGISVMTNLRLFVKKSLVPYLPDSLSAEDLWCEVGSEFKLNIGKYIRGYYDINDDFVLTANSPFTVEGLLVSYQIPSLGVYSLDVTARYTTQTGVSTSSYEIECVDPLVVSVTGNGNIFHSQTYQETIAVSRSGTVINLSSLKTFFVAGDKPSNMAQPDLATGILTWFVDVNENKLLTLSVYAEDQLIPSHSITSTFTITINQHAYPSYSTSTVQPVYINCELDSSNPNRDCYLTDSISTILPISYCDTTCTYSLYTLETSVSLAADIITWSRLNILYEDLYLPSKPITVIITDEYGAYTRSNSFTFTPRFQPVISDLSFVDGFSSENLLSAYVGCVWKRSFSITQWDVSYPTDNVIQESQVTINFGTKSAGVIEWYPSTIGTVSIIISYVDTFAITVSRTFTVQVNVIAFPVCDAFVQSAPFYVNEEVVLDVGLMCSTVEGYNNVYSLNQGAPTGCLLFGSKVVWTPTVTGVYTIRFLVYSETIFNYLTYSATFIIQPRLSMKIGTNKSYYSVPLYTKLSQDTSCISISKSLITYSLVSSTYAISLNNYGDIYWAYPHQDLTIEVTMTLSASSSLLADTITSSFTIIMQSNVLTINISPFPDSYKTALISSVYQVSATCSANKGSPLITVPSLSKFSVSQTSDDSVTLSWSPTLQDNTPELVVLTCSVASTSVSYHFIPVPIYPSSTPVCSDATVTIRRGVLSGFSLDWTTDLYDFNEYSLSCSNVEGLTCYHYGYVEWMPSVDPLIYSASVYINGIQRCNIAAVYESRPYLTSFQLQICDNALNSCMVTVDIVCEGTSNIAYTLNNTVDASVTGNSVIWNPSSTTTSRYLNLEATNIIGTDSTSLFFCQGASCRYNPYIDSITSDSPLCESVGSALKCSFFIPETIEIYINGRNFGANSVVVYIGDIQATVISFVDTRIICVLPLRNADFVTDIIVSVVATDSNGAQKKSQGFAMISYVSSFKPTLTMLSNYYVMEDQGKITVSFTADFLLPLCSCQTSIAHGVLIYTGLDSKCEFDSSQLTSGSDHDLTLCYFTECSNSVIFRVIKSINAAMDINSGHNHGGYIANLILSYSGTCTDLSTFLSFGGQIIQLLIPCSSFTQQPYTYPFRVPVSLTCSLSSLDVLLSLNHGHTFIKFSTFSYTGCCVLSQYMLNNQCRPCPVGHYCNYQFASQLSYFSTPIPCNLGYYQDLTGQTTCRDCPLGYQCYCRGLSAPIICDAGYICSELRTVKRRLPCPKGRYCRPGTYLLEPNSFDASGNPITAGVALKCNEGTYCINGIYSATVDIDNYHAHSCRTGFHCEPGSTNEFGLTDCDTGYFCNSGFVSITGYDSTTLTCVNSKCECPPGYACPTATLQLPNECSNGQYQPQSKKTSCIECPSGYYCPKNPIAIAAIICPIGSACTNSVTEPTYCPLGYYQPSAGQAACIPCSPGTYQNNMNSISCLQCPGGYYCDESGLSSPKPCPAGFYCTPGTNHGVLNGCLTTPSTLTDIYPIPCPVHFYCPLRSNSIKICKVGTYTDELCSSVCQNCPEGYTCPGNGIKSICPAGFYCVNNHKFSCLPGYYCLEGTSTNNTKSSVSSRPMPCLAGTYCSIENTSPNPNSGIGAAQYCSKGTYNGNEGQAVCFACPPGYECPDIGMTAPVLCNQGSYRENNTRILSCIKCQEGTYNNKTGSVTANDCLKCSAGVVCSGMGMANPNSTNSRPCTAGYICLAGTGSGSSSSNPCPAGTYCIEGTKSLEEASKNLCPQGRYCAKGTPATISSVKSCENQESCEIGTPCAVRYYCPEGTEEMIPCSPWTTSKAGSYSLTQCYRDSNIENFYNVKIVKNVVTSESFELEPFMYSEFTVDFLKYYSEAKMPVDYQAVMIVTSAGSKRKLADESLRFLIIADNDYGPKQSIPLPFSQAAMLAKTQQLTVAVGSNMKCKLRFDLQFLNGSYFSQESHISNITSNLLVHLKTSTKLPKGFVCVLTKDIGNIFEDPINYYTLISVDSNSKLKHNRTFENDFFMSVITESDSPTWEDYMNIQNSTSIWSNRNSSFALAYLPYITDCYPGYGSMIPINVLMNDSRCGQSDFYHTSAYSPEKWLKDQKKCDIFMKCKFDLDPTVANRRKRWYEAENEKFNTKVTTKDEVPIFYLSKFPIESSRINSKLASDELVSVMAVRNIDSSWKTGEFPLSIKLSVNYYQRTEDSPEIVEAFIEFSSFTDNSSYTTYDFNFVTKSLGWVDCFDKLVFTPEEYYNLLLIFALFLIAFMIFSLILSFLILPATRRVKGLKMSLKLLLNAIKGLPLMIVPMILTVTSMMMMLYHIDYFKYIPGNFTDKTIITDLSSSKVSIYLSSRAGIIFIVFGLYLLNLGSGLLIPPTSYYGFSYELQKLQVKDLQDLPKKQGLVLGSVIFVSFISILFDTLSELPLFQTWYFIFFPVILLLEYIFKVFILKGFEDEVNTLPARLGLKVGIFSMTLNVFTLHLALLLFCVLHCWRFLYSAILEKYHQIFVFEYLRKNIEKRKIVENSFVKHGTTYAAAELSERTLGVICSFVYPLVTLFVYIWGDLYSYMMNSKCFEYFLIFQAFFLFFEPVQLILVSFIRSLRDKDFKSVDTFERAEINYKQRLSRWALSFIKIHDETIHISSIEESAFMSSWSSQLFFSLTPFAFGTFFLVHACKMWKISQNSPFMDYWMFVIGLSTLILCTLIRTIIEKIGKKFFWNISHLNQLYIVGADGRTITSREEYIYDIMLRKRIEGESFLPAGNFFISDFSEEIMKIIKDSDTDDIRRLLIKSFKEKEIFYKINSQKIFDEVNNRLVALKEQKIDERIAKATEPLYKLSLIKAKMVKTKEQYPKFAKELIYPW